MNNSKPEPVCRLLATALMLACAPLFAGDIDPVLRTATGDKPIDVLIAFDGAQRSSLTPLRADADYLQRRAVLVEALRARAEHDQSGVQAWLDARGIPWRSYWISNVIAASLDRAQIEELAAREDIRRIAADTPSRMRTLPEASRPLMPDTASLPWGLETIHAPQVWALGVNGQGVVLAGQDTGYQWDHPALKTAYRGWNGAVADHDYNWHDAVHEYEPWCGADSSEPCDDDNHGTHTMGTMVGDDGAGTTVGVAPGARWMGCRNMRAGYGTPSTYIECMQWLLAPTDGDDLNPRPDLAPDVISNSWGCVYEEGCITGEEVHAAVDNVVAGGIFFVAAAGNDGWGCFSIGDPPATYSASFVVGATDSGDALAYFSSRGPVSGVDRTLPDIVAPGVWIRSSVPMNGYGSMDGTSMATPHVAGVAALMMSVNPALKGDPARVAELLRASAERNGITDPINSGCGGLTMADWPNHQAGHGRLDAYRAVILADTLFADDFDG